MAGALHRTGKGRPWLSMRTPASTVRSAPRQARGSTALRDRQQGLPWPAAARPGRRPASQPRSSSRPAKCARDSYDAISKLNIVDNVAKITRAFYERLGLSPQQSPVVQVPSQASARSWRRRSRRLAPFPPCPRSNASSSHGAPTRQARSSEALAAVSRGDRG